MSDPGKYVIGADQIAAMSESQSMVERVAAALAEADDIGWDRLYEDKDDEHPVPHGRIEYRTRARAVIAAMREPTEAMLHAGLVAVNLQNSYLNVVRRAMIDVVYRAMIDEALK